jgi:predicted secreted hydrolase
MPNKKLLTIGDSPELLQKAGLDASNVALWEDGQRADTGPGSFEWWYFDAHLEDGSTAVIVYSTKLFTERTGPLKPFVRLVITTPDRRELSGFTMFNPAQFSATKAQCDVKISHNYARGDLHHYELRAECGELAADLAFNGVVPPWRPGSGINYYDEALTRYFGWLPAIPHGKVEGTLTYEGKVHKVTGTGYHDHNWGNIGLADVMSHWYWGRAHVAGYTVIFVEMTGTAAYGSQKLPVFMLAHHDKILTGNGAPLTLEVREFEKHPGGRQFPLKVDFDWKSTEGEVHIALRRPQVIEATSLLTLLPPWQRRVARLFANPYYFRFNSEMKIKIDLAGEKASEKGQALFEIMMLR